MRVTAGALYRWGRIIGRSTGVGRVRWWGGALGALLVCFSLVSLTATSATLGGRATRADASSPQIGPMLRHPAKLLWMPLHFDYLNDRLVTVVGLEPLTKGAPLPPGVSFWPRPGEAILSPQLARDLPQDRRGRYGQVAGRIGEQGLITPTDYTVYLRPTIKQLTALRGRRATTGSDVLIPASGFGVTGGVGYPQATVINEPVGWQVLMLVGVTLAIPSVLGLFVMTGSGAERRRERALTLRRVGATRGEMLALEIGAAWRAVAVGAGLSAVLTVWAMSHDMPLPGLRYVVVAQDLRAHALGVIGALLAGVMLSLGIMCAPPRLVRGRRWRPAARDEGVPAAAPLIAVLALVLILFLPRLAPAGWAAVIVYEAIFVALLLTLPSLAALLVAAAGRAVANLGRGLGAAAAIIAGRQLVQSRRRTTEIAITLVVGTLVLGQAVAWAGQLGVEYQRGVATRAAVGSQVLLARQATSGADLKGFLAALPPNVLAARFDVYPEDPPHAVLTSSCEVLRSIGSTCTPQPRAFQPPAADPALVYLAQWTAPLRTRQGPIEGAGDGSGLVLVSRDRQPLNQAFLQNLGYRNVVGGLGLESMGQAWVVGATPRFDQAHWVMLLGFGALAVLTLSLGMRVLADLMRSAAVLAPLTALASRRSVFWSICGWRMMTTFLVTSFVAAAAYLVAGEALGAMYASLAPRTSLAGGVILLAAILGALLAALGGRLAWSLALAWRPGKAV